MKVRKIVFSFVFASLLMILLPSSCYAQGKTDAILSIAFSRDDGRCNGNCFKECTIDANKIICVVKEHPSTPSVIQDTTVLTPMQWKKLIDLFDRNTFYKLPTKIGCPGCNDGPIYIIEITSVNKEERHRVVFGYEKDLSDLAGFLKEVKRLTDIR